MGMLGLRKREETSDNDPEATETRMSPVDSSRGNALAPSTASDKAGSLDRQALVSDDPQEACVHDDAPVATTTQYQAPKYVAADRINTDGTIRINSEPKLKADGTFQRPRGTVPTGCM